jgi:phosphoglycolate phosphatase-like HAD superfamily hydrolase
LAFDPTRVQALLFDIDGTLSDTDDQMVAHFSRVLRPLKSILPNRDVHAAARWLVMGLETPGNFIYTKLDRLGLDGPVGRLLNTLSHRRAGRKPKYFQIVPGVSEMLARLAELYPLAIVSARGDAVALAFLDQFGLRPYFKAVITSQTCEYTKPFPDPVREAARQLKVPVESCVMIGDTTVDMHAGKAAGTQTIGVLCGFGRRSELLRAGADVILETTAGVEAALVG